MRTAALLFGPVLFMANGLVTAAGPGSAPVTVWREVEDIASNWGFSSWRPKEQGENPHWFSGRGAARQKEPGEFTWRFQIRSEVDEQTLQPITRTYYVHMRLYGFRQRPPITLHFDGSQIADFRTRKTEKTDARGEYVSAGTFYWEPAGSFEAAGGQHAITAKVSGTGAWVDAILVTTDPSLRPVQLEARDTADASFFTDLRSHEIHAQYRYNGVSRQLTCPVVFRPYPLGRRAFFVTREQQAVFHVVVPDPVEVVAVSSHFVGVRWKDSRAHKHVGLRSVGRPGLGERPATHYAIDVSYMGLDLLVYMRAGADGFEPGRVLKGRYWLDFDGDGQTPAELPLYLVDVPSAKPFKKIFIGPAGGTATCHWADYPQFTRAMQRVGMNLCNPWWLDARLADNADVVGPFLDQCRTDGIMVFDEHSPFFGTFGPHRKREPEDFAVTRDGKRSRHPSLIVGEATLGRSLARFRNIGAVGIQGVVIDDEAYNQRCDDIDYSERVKAAFREYLARHTDLAYEDPLAIVERKAERPRLYEAWVDFKCRCVLERYKRYRDAFEAGLRAADTQHGRTFFIAQILRNKTPQESRTNTYWDYRLLAEHCTHISPMIYTYGGLAQSGTVGDVVEMYSEYVGRNIIAPTLLAGHLDFGEVRLPDKAMIRYEIIEALIHKAPGILFWNVAGTMNALNLAEIAKGIRLTQPYEDIFMDGRRFRALAATPPDTRVRALKLGPRLLVYVARYAGDAEAKATVCIEEGRVVRVLDVAAEREMTREGNGFVTDFVRARGRLFLLTLAD